MGGSSTVSAGAATSSASSGVEFGHLPPAWEPTPVRPRLPVGVAVVSVLIAGFGLVVLLAGLLFLLATIPFNVVPPSLEIFPTIDLYGAAVLAVLGAALIGIATSLWRQETWALWTTLVLVFATAAYLFFTDDITVLFLVFVVLFLYLISVRRYFY
jgi:chromate transport protein ChrA